ncbi:glutaredoxin-C1-like [Humulus lupulus]|uniref:glutaredoxin-C1-like n=1 Tax=Humulus lupulus TaxID=3486 RepID=UPI002B4064E2|nr:glutaredoxin-C1-like [Humulus lupulus]
MQAVAKKPSSTEGARMMEIINIDGGGESSSSSSSRLAMMGLESSSPYEMVRQLGSCNAVVVFSMSGCCMSTVVKQLLFGLGVGPTVVELDQHVAGPHIEAVLFDLLGAGGRRQPVPAVFVGGKFLGGVETLMACHINGTLVPLLKDAGALWL